MSTPANLPQVDQQETTKRRLSMLESLPAELIQPIFLFSENINLPLSSPYIAAALSTERIYLSILLKAFALSISDSDQQRYANLQSTLLSRRWMNLIVWRRFMEDWDSRRESAESSSPDLFIRFVEGTALPSKVLHGPFGPSGADKTSLLGEFVRGGARVDWENSSSGEVATAGLHEAILASDGGAVAWLLSPGSNIVPNKSHLIAVITTNGCNRHIADCVICAASRARSIDFEDQDLLAWVDQAERNDAMDREELQAKEQRILRSSPESFPDDSIEQLLHKTRLDSLSTFDWLLEKFREATELQPGESHWQRNTAEEK
ncbi:MAG: hypothetical protein M1817_001166 [Caeruleum heppii]|nr:MAG: hypothetical protein M1817_001166 [Caeruleum heppii]